MSEASQAFNAVAFADALHGWVACTSGAILATVDGGRHWSRQASGCDEGLYSITFVDARQGWTAGSGGVLLHTMDGGTTWTRTVLPNRT